MNIVQCCSRYLSVLEGSAVYGFFYSFHTSRVGAIPGPHWPPLGVLHSIIAWLPNTLKQLELPFRPDSMDQYGTK